MVFGAGKASVQASKAPPDLNFTSDTAVHTNNTINDVWTMTDDGSVLTASGALNPNIVLSSNDGTTWTERTTGFGSTTWRSASDGTTHVHVQIAGNLTLESTDPESNNWNSRTVYGSGFNLGRHVIYDSTTGLFIYVGTDLTNARLATSPDGITWTERTVPAGLQSLDVVYRSSNNTLVAVGQDGSNSAFITSTNGTTWSGSETTFDTGTSDLPRAGLYDSVNDFHFFITMDEWGYVGNNSGPPNTADWTEVGTNEGDTNGHLVQATPGGPIVGVGAGTDTLIKWTNDFSTVETYNPTNLLGVLGVHYSTVDNEYYAHGRITGPTRGRIVRLNQS